MSHAWLGNVREIRSTALRYNAFGGDNSAGDILKPQQLAPEDNGASTERAADEHIQNNESAEVSHVTDVLADDMIPLSDLSNTVEQLVISALENKGLSKTDIAAKHWDSADRHLQKDEQGVAVRHRVNFCCLK